MLSFLLHYFLLCPMRKNIAILHNIVSPYKTLLFNEIYNLGVNITVIFMAESERNREWNIDEKEFAFPHEFLFRGELDTINIQKMLDKVWKRLDAINPDVLIFGGYNYVAYWAGFFWAKIKKKKIILWSSTNKEDRDRTFVKELIKSTYFKRFDAANVYGSRSRDYLIQLGLEKSKIFVKGNVTDNSFYFNESEKARKLKKLYLKKYKLPPNNFLFIGRFSKEKNIFSLLKAFEKLDTNEWGLILVGDGPERGGIEAYIEKNIFKRVILPGFKQKEEIPVYLGLSDVLILPSLSETWGLVVNEAMAAGLPVVVSNRCGCYPDLINEGVNGYSFNPYDGDELLAILNKILKQKGYLKGMGEASREMIKNYTPRKSAEIIKKTIEFVQSR